MKRNTIFRLIIGFIILATLYTAAAWWTGKSAEYTVQKQKDWLNSQPYFMVKKQVYSRGWFSSDVLTTLALNPNFYTFLLPQTSTGELPLFEFTYKQHITHGPLPLLTHFNPRPYKAVISTEFVFSPEIQKRLIQFFGKEKPLSIIERITFNDDSKATFTVPGFDYEELVSGVKIKWSGLKGNMAYSGDLSSRFTLHGAIANATVSAAPKGTFNLSNFLMNIDKNRGKTGLLLGTQGFKVDKLDIHWLDNLPLHAIVNKLAYVSKLTEAADYVNGAVTIAIDSFSIDNKTSGPARFRGEATHLHAPTLLKLAKESEQLQKSSFTTGTSQESALAHIVRQGELLRQSGIPLLEHNPALAINEFFVKTPDGDIHLTANIGLQGFEKADIDNPLVLFNKINAQANISIPRSILEALIVLQTQNMFGSEQVDDNEDIAALIRQIVDGQINKLVQEKYIRLEGNNILTQAVLKQGQLTLNKVPVLLPWQQPAPVLPLQ